MDEGPPAVDKYSKYSFTDVITGASTTRQFSCRIHVAQKMVLPLSLLRSSSNYPILVELKSGEAYSGVMTACDGWMNIHMRDAVLTSKDGDRFWKVPECYIRGNNVKYLRIPEEVVDIAAKESHMAAQAPHRPTYDGGKGGKGYGKGKGKGKGMHAGSARF